MEWSHTLEVWILGLAGTPWILPVMYVLAVLDGVFPPLPNESILTAMAVATVTGHTKHTIWTVMAVGAFGAMSGDLLAWTVGRFLLPKEMKGKKGKALQAAREGLDKHWLSVLTTGRFIPGWRIIVNMGCGSIHLPLRKFIPISALTATIWSVYHALVGVAAGALLRERPLLGIIAGVIFGLVLGAGLERLARAFNAKMGVKAPKEEPAYLKAKQHFEGVTELTLLARQGRKRSQKRNQKRPRPNHWKRRRRTQRKRSRR